MPYLVEQGFSRGDLGFALSGDLDCLWIFEIHHGFGIGSLESARFPARRFDSGGGSDVVYGLCAMGDVEHCGDVCTVVPLRLVPWDGVAAVWSYYGALVVAERTWRHCVSVELCAQRRWWYSAAAVPAGDGWFNDWHAALYMPAFCAILVALFAFAMMRDTPQSCGLPPIEEYKNDYPDDYNEKAEQELTAKQIFMQYVLPNKLLWYIAIANVFVYLLRYGILDWSPTYLKEVKHFALDKSSGPTSFMNMQVFRALCCAAGCRIKSSVATVGQPAFSL